MGLELIEKLQMDFGCILAKMHDAAYSHLQGNTKLAGKKFKNLTTSSFFKHCSLIISTSEEKKNQLTSRTAKNCLLFKFEVLQGVFIWQVLNVLCFLPTFLEN